MACPISSSNTSVNGTPVGVNGGNEILGGISYTTVWIGNKRWLAENLRGNFGLGTLDQKTSVNDWANTIPNSTVILLQLILVVVTRVVYTTHELFRI
jgi:hypothetical protein